MAEPVNQLELADVLGVDPKTIRGWERQGCPVAEKPAKRGAPKLYMVADVARWWNEQARLAASGDLNAMDIEEARRRKLAADAAMSELALAREKGDAVSIAIVAKEVGAMLSACRSRLLAVPSAVAPQLELASGAAAYREIIEAGIYEALDEISDTAFAFGDDAESDDPEDGPGFVLGRDEAAAEADA